MALAACGTPPYQPAITEPPEIAHIEWLCEGDERRVEVWTHSLTRGGMIWMDNGERRERHALISIAAAADGSEDHLRTVLRLIEDPALIQNGSSSAFLCGDAPLRQVYLASYDYEQSACVRDEGFPEIEGIAPCETLWTED